MARKNESKEKKTFREDKAEKDTGLRKNQDDSEVSVYLRQKEDK